MKVLIAEDEHITAILYKTIIERLGHEVVALAHTSEEAISKTCELRPNVAFLDINMEHRTAGIEACKYIKERCPEITVYFLTAYSKDTFEKELENVPYDGYIDKWNFMSTVEELLK